MRPGDNVKVTATGEAVQAAREDATIRADLVHTLTRLRVEADLTRKDVAALMGAKLRDVEQFEAGRTNLRLWFAQAYARAVGARVRVEVVR